MKGALYISNDEVKVNWLDVQYGNLYGVDMMLSLVKVSRTSVVRPIWCVRGFFGAFLPFKRQSKELPFLVL